MIRPADALLAASIMISSSMMLSFTGTEHGWTRKTSRSRTFSKIRTKVLSLLNLNTSQAPSAMDRCEQMSFANCGWAFPVNTFRSLDTGMAFSLVIRCK